MPLLRSTPKKILFPARIGVGANARAFGVCAALALVCGSLGAGCSEEEPPPPPVTDLGPRPDFGVRDLGVIVRRDASVADGGAVDSGGTGEDDGGASSDLGVATDAETSGITVDGTLGAGEWSDAMVFTSSQSAASTAFAGNSLDALYVVRTTDTLYFAVEGALSGIGRAIVAYLDVDVGAGTGEVNTATLADETGELDAALSTSLTLPVGFRVDAGWGTLDFGRTASPSDTRMGFRSFANVSSFATLGGQTVCGPSLCEAAIPLEALGANASLPVGIFVRLVDGTGAVSNQTLPMDDAGAPEIVTNYASVDPAE